MEGSGKTWTFSTVARDFLASAFAKYTPGYLIRVCGPDCDLGHCAVDSPLGRPDDPRHKAEGKSLYSTRLFERRDRRLTRCTAARRETRPPTSVFSPLP